MVRFSIHGLHNTAVHVSANNCLLKPSIQTKNFPQFVYSTIKNQIKTKSFTKYIWRMFLRCKNIDKNFGWGHYDTDYGNPLSRVVESGTVVPALQVLYHSESCSSTPNFGQYMRSQFLHRGCNTCSLRIKCNVHPGQTFSLK